MLIGSKGRDRYIYTDLADSTASKSDTVRWRKTDRFDFTSFDGNLTTDGQQNFIG